LIAHERLRWAGGARAHIDCTALGVHLHGRLDIGRTEDQLHLSRRGAGGEVHIEHPEARHLRVQAMSTRRDAREREAAIGAAGLLRMVVQGNQRAGDDRSGGVDDLAAQRRSAAARLRVRQHGEDTDCSQGNRPAPLT
jgi:hypothetical protein